MFNKIKIIQNNYLLKLILINIFLFCNFSNIYCIERESQFLTSNNTSTSLLVMVGIGLIGFSIGYGLCYLYNRSVVNQNQNNINSNPERNQDLNNINSNSDIDQLSQNSINSNSDVDEDQNNINSNPEINQDLNNINSANSNLEINQDLNNINLANSNPEINQDLNNINSEDLIFIGPSNYDILQLGLDQLVNINDLFNQNHFNLQYLTDLPLLQTSNLSNSTTELNNVICLLNSIQKQNLEIYKLLDNINSLYLLYLNGN